MNPTKQGLKHSQGRTPSGSKKRVLAHESNKTRIETPVAMRIEKFDNTVLAHESNKTRIETARLRPCPAGLPCLSP